MTGKRGGVSGSFSGGRGLSAAAIVINLRFKNKIADVDIEAVFDTPLFACFTTRVRTH